MADDKPAEAAPEVKPASAPAPADANPAAAPAAVPAGRTTTCAQCGKRLDRKKQYYRNGRYFCNKRCWRSAAAGIPSQPAVA